MKLSSNDFAISVCQELSELLHLASIDGSIRSFTVHESGNKFETTLSLETVGVTWDVKVMKSTQAS